MSQVEPNMPGAGALPAPAGLELPISGPSVTRPDRMLVAQLETVGVATASAVLHWLGIRRAFIRGPVTRRPGSRITAPAITLQFMPQREDIASGVGQEASEKTSALWAVLEEITQGDALVVQAGGDPDTGCLGEMLCLYLQGRGGVGLVVDGRVRDWAKIARSGLPVWATGTTPNYSSQAGLFPWAYNVPVNCGGALVLPGDVVVADDDGAVVVPAAMIRAVLEVASSREQEERFAREQLAAGGSLKRYYPLSDEAREEFERWQAAE